MGQLIWVTGKKGRLAAKSVISCNSKKSEIIKSINFLYSEKFKKILKCIENPYYKENTSNKVISILKNEIPKLSIQKQFYDFK